MKKDIIISGPTASGKSWIASAIEQTHSKIALRVIAGYFIEALHEKKITKKLLKNRSMIIVDECTNQDILNLDINIRTFLIDQMGNDNYPIIYLTKEEVTNKSLKCNNFHIIHCRNAHI